MQQFYYEEPKATELENKRYKIRSKGKRMLYDCLKAKVTTHDKVLCILYDFDKYRFGVPYSAVLAGLTPSQCKTCLDYRSDIIR